MTTSEGGLTAEDWQRIREFARMDPDDRSPEDLVPDTDPRRNGAAVDDETGESGVSSGSSTGESSRTCREIRERMDRATTAKEVVEAYPDRHVSEVMRHAYGDCTCSTEHPPVASPQIQPAECREFRDAYAEGSSVSEIDDEFARSTNAVVRHLFGRCSHASTPRDLSPSEVSERTCKQLRETYHGDGDVDVRGVATAVRLRPEVVRFHLYGFCFCDHGVPPAENYTPQNPYHPEHPRLQAGD